MPVEIDGYINEGESAWIDVTATDVDGTSVVPKSMTYWWTDANGTAINERTNITVEAGDLGATTQIELTPDDTALFIPRDRERIFTVRYIYDSVRGNDKVRTESGTVTIKNHVAYNVP